MRILHRLSWAGRTALLIVFLLSACKPQVPAPAATPTLAAPVNTATPLPLPSPTPEPRTLVVCLGQEPQTLFPLSGRSAALWNVLESVYDGPFDLTGYQPQPVIMQEVPSLAGGSVSIQPVSVAAGDEVIDAQGSLTVLAKGTLVRSSGCSGDACGGAWDGASDLLLDQMTVTFKLLPGLKWSDGQALTAEDSVYAYTLASDPASTATRAAVERTASYTAADDQTVTWMGKPGLVDPDYTSQFWQPLPRHAWGTAGVATLLASEDASVKPIGWGPYVIDEWVKGDHITLHKNPYYFRASEGLPKFDTLVYRFLKSDPNAALTSLLVGECDVVDRNVHLEEQLPSLMELAGADKLNPVFASGPEWEQVDFGIKPAAYDDGYNVFAGDRPDFFADLRTRQAFAYCMDRQSAVDRVLKGRAPLMNSYLSPDNPAYDADLPGYPYDPQEGSRLLDEVGWKDTDNDPATPRVASGVPQVPPSAPLSVTYLTSQAPVRQQVGQILAQSMAACGIEVKFQPVAMGDLFAEGPAGPVFGRSFDLVQFAWQSGSQPQCYLYESGRVPNAANTWLGVNVSGYASPEFDAACQSSMQLLPEVAGYQEAQNQAQVLFANDLPAVPLYPLLKVAAARPGLCGFSLSSSARSDMWAIESFDTGNCSQ